MELIVLYGVFAVIVGVVAGSWGRSGFLWFLLAVIISPLIAFIVLLIAGKVRASSENEQAGAATGQRVRCEQCHELIYPQALICKHCGSKRAPTVAREDFELSQRALTAESYGRSLAMAVRNRTLWVVVAAALGGVYIASHPDAIERAARLIPW